MSSSGKPVVQSAAGQLPRCVCAPLNTVVVAYPVTHCTAVTSFSRSKRTLWLRDTQIVKVNLDIRFRKQRTGIKSYVARAMVRVLNLGQLHPVNEKGHRLPLAHNLQPIRTAATCVDRVRLGPLWRQ